MSAGTTGSPIVEARGLSRSYGDTLALDHIDLRINAGRIVGIVGANGAGKTTALNAMLGLTSFTGHLRVLGLDPWRQRDTLMQQVAFITDVAVLPRWIRVDQLVDYIEGVHPHFERAKATDFLARTSIRPKSRVRELSKGMVTQLHLAMVMAIDARLLVLDEPTLGLDVLFRKRFYDSLLDDYFEGTRTIVIATHNMDEIENVVTDVLFLDRGKVVFTASTEEIDRRFREVRVRPEHVSTARELGPVHERDAIGQRIMLFDGAPMDRLEELGDVRRPTIADLFVATVETTRR
jgi:ABC-2 type transport system ATP-binding protein